jgi:hypothetical protein
MASFESHLQQANTNLLFFKQNQGTTFYDWQVTICFYVSVHIVNSHLAKMANLHYNTHEQTKLSLNPSSEFSICKIDTLIYDKYILLEKLSRRSRYLCNDINPSNNEIAFITTSKHLSKAVKHLNDIIVYFASKHEFKIQKIEITCPRLKAELPATLEYFK